jgi:hypothetical protein
MVSALAGILTMDSSHVCSKPYISTHSIGESMSNKAKWAIGMEALVILVCWAGGYNFNERGMEAVFFALLSAIVILATLSCPFIKEPARSKLDMGIDSDGRIYINLKDPYTAKVLIDQAENFKGIKIEGDK